MHGYERRQNVMWPCDTAPHLQNNLQTFWWNVSVWCKPGSSSVSDSLFDSGSDMWSHMWFADKTTNQSKADVCLPDKDDTDHNIPTLKMAIK